MSLFPLSKHTPNIYLESQEINTREDIYNKLDIILEEVDNTWSIAMKAKPLANKDRNEVAARINKFVGDFKNRVFMFRFNVISFSDFESSKERLHYIIKDAQDTIQKIKNEFEVNKKENEAFAKKRDQVASNEKKLQNKLKNDLDLSLPPKYFFK